MTKSFLARGILAGLIAGLCAVAFAKAFAEPHIAKAERFEGHAQILAGTPVERPSVSRGVQDTIGLGVGVAVAGVAHGGLFGLAFAAVYRRMGPAGAQTTAISLATSAFVAIFLIPFLKYPANLPSVATPTRLVDAPPPISCSCPPGILSAALASTARRLLASRLGGGVRRCWEPAP